MTPLRKRMIDAFEQRNFPPNTAAAYVAAVAAIAAFYGESPDKLSPSTVQAWLAVQRKTRRPEEVMVIDRGLSFFYAEVVTTPPSSSPPKPGSALRQRMTDELIRRNFAPRSIEAYVGAIARFARHYGRCPSTLGEKEIQGWQLLLGAVAPTPSTPKAPCGCPTCGVGELVERMRLAPFTLRPMDSS